MNALFTSCTVHWEAVTVPFESTAQSDLNLLVSMLRDASRSRDAKEVLAAFARRLWRVNPIEALVSLSVRGLPKGQYKVTRCILRNEIDLSDQSKMPDPWQNWALMPAFNHGFLAQVIAEGTPQLFGNLQLEEDPVLGDRLASMRSAVATPLYDGGEALNWNLQFRSEPEAYTHDDLVQHVLQANLIGTVTRNLIAVQRETALKQKLQHQLDELASVQRALLPSTLPKIPGLKLAASYLTSEEAGGDYYDFFELPRGRWGVLIADVAGHGAAAAAVMAMLHAILHGYKDDENSPAGVIQYANRRLVESSISGRFVTAFFGVYDPANSSLMYVRAGHNPPYLKRANGELQVIDGGGTLPLGVMDPIDIESDTLHFGPGDTLVLYTDGITEAFDGQRRLFGVERMAEALQSCSLHPDDVIQSVHAALYRYTGRLDRDDDQTLVVMQRTDEVIHP